MEPTETKRPPGFQKGHPLYGGRKKGVLPKMPTLLKECVLEAARLEGRDGKGKDGLIGFLRRLANEDIRAFAFLLGRVLRLQLQSREDVNVNVVYETVEEVQKEMFARGLTRQTMLDLADMMLNEVEPSDGRETRIEIEGDGHLRVGKALVRPDDEA
jgi:hypothetical protein